MPKNSIPKPTYLLTGPLYQKYKKGRGKESWTLDHKVDGQISTTGA